MSRLLALVALVSLVLPVTISAGCTQTVAEGTDKYELFLLEETAPVTFEIEWKHNSQLVFKRKSKKINPGKPEDITERGALVLRQLAAKHVGTYVGEVWGNEGESVKKQEIDLCVKARVPKPTVTFDCPTKDTVTISCNLKQSDVTFTWTKNKVIMKGEKTSTLVMKIKDLKRDDTFSCTVDDTYSNETSDSVKSTCEGIQGGSEVAAGTLLGFPFWVTVSVLAVGGGFVLLLIVITVVCCYRNHCKSHEDEEAEFRLAPLTQPQPQPQPRHKDPAHKQKSPMDATRPLPSTGAPRQASAQPRAQARGRPAPPPQDEDEDCPPPLPQPRRSGPRPPYHGAVPPHH
ncbi:T-cell surface antigen CD2-like [Osmerus eperlanus]|uniref:T-cell surface antigen CD2-like n=1 Tax=Osmerus eperlanus TaxID=29151 RepID=UPI002E15EF4D